MDKLFPTFAVPKVVEGTLQEENRIKLVNFIAV